MRSHHIAEGISGERSGERGLGVKSLAGRGYSKVSNLN